MPDHRLNTFYTVAKLQSYSRAAEELHITQPTVSFQIRQLENHYGTKLIDMRQGQFTLTEAGKIVFEFAERIIRMYKEMDQTVTEAVSTATNQLLLGASATPGEYILPAIIGDFQALNPEVTLFLRIDNTRRILELLNDERIDLAVVGKRPENDAFISRIFITDEMVLIAGANTLYATMKQVNPSEFNDVPLLLREEGSASRAEAFNALQQAGIDVQRISKRLTLGSIEAIKRAVEAGMGVAVVSKWSVMREIERGSLKAIPIVNITFARKFYFIYKANYYKEKLVNRFIDFAISYNVEALHMLTP
jgi:DNA-binding transcriptional LysR family regulator